MPPQTSADRIAARLFAPVSAVLAVVFAWVLVTQSHQTAATQDSDLTGALAAVQRLPGTRHVLCEDFAWCNAFVALPLDHVFIDGRADPYPSEVWKDYSTIIFVKPGWHRTLRARGADVVIAAITSPLEAVLTLSPDWHSVYANHTMRVWELVTKMPPQHKHDTVASRI
jgi:hypothetical protein